MHVDTHIHTQQNQWPGVSAYLCCTNIPQHISVRQGKPQLICGHQSLCAPHTTTYTHFSFSLVCARALCLSQGYTSQAEPKTHSAKRTQGCSLSLPMVNSLLYNLHLLKHNGRTGDSEPAETSLNTFLLLLSM